MSSSSRNTMAPAKLRYAMPGQLIHKRARVPEDHIGNDHRRPPLKQITEQLPQRIHEVDGRLLRAHGIHLKRILLPHPRKAIEYLPMRQDDAFRLTSRTGSVNDVCRSVRLYRHGEIVDPTRLRILASSTQMMVGPTDSTNAQSDA